MSQTHTQPDRGSTYSTPRWVKVFGIIALVLVLLFVILHLTGNSLGGPGGMTPPGGPGGPTPPIAHGVTVFGIIVIVLVLLFGILHLAGISLSGPGGHTPPGGAGDARSGSAGDTPSGDAGGHTPPKEHGVQQP